MNRRSFISLIAPAAAALIVPSRTIFLPPRCGWPIGDHPFHERGCDIAAAYGLIYGVDYSIGMDATSLVIRHRGEIIHAGEVRDDVVVGMHFDGSRLTYLKNGEVLRTFDV